MGDEERGPQLARQPLSWPELSIEQLEILLLAKRQERAARLVRRIAAAEHAPMVSAASAPWEPGVALQPPESASGRLARDVLTPQAETAAQARAHMVRRSSLLLFVELAFLLAFVTVIGLTLARLQALNDELRRLRATAVIAVPSITPPVRAWSAPRPTPTMASAPALLPALAGNGPLSQLGRGGEAPTATAMPTAAATQTVSAGVSAATATPVASGAPLRLVIAAIGVDAPVTPGDDWEALKQGVGHRAGSANPGERGNMVVSAHNDIYGEIFRHLDQAQPGDEVLIYTAEQVYRYLVSSVELVEPAAVEVMAPTDYPVLTMITCYPYLVDTQRVVVRAALAP